MADIANGVGHGTAAEGHAQAGNRARMAKAGTVVDVIGADARTHNF